MNRPIMEIKDIHGNIFGEKKVISINWDDRDVIWAVEVDFMGKVDSKTTNNSNDFVTFYNYNEKNVNPLEYKNNHGNLIGTLIFKT